MCIAGLAPAYLSMHSCALEIRAGLLGVLPLKNNPLNRRWYVVHVESKALSHVAAVFEEYLVTNGELEIESQLHEISKVPLTPNQ